MLDLVDLKEKTVDELKEIAGEMEIPGHSGLRKSDLCMEILKVQSEQDGNKYEYGVLEVSADGRGYLRVNGYTPDPSRDVYVADSQIRRFDLRTGDLISGPVRPPKNSERYWSLLRVQTINSLPPEDITKRPDFEDLTPVYPDQRLILETDSTNIAGRLLDVVVLLDSITRLSRASNLTIDPSGRTLSGGLDPTALYRPKRFLGAARNIEGGGSLTILATILVETGSRMDDMIFEEFKATGNMDLVLSRQLADRGIFPAVDIARSSTRHQELLFGDGEMQAIWQLRKALHNMEPAEALETLLAGVNKTKDNQEFLSMATESFAR